MATLLISAAINIAIGLAINALFPPPDIEQEGPRLADLGFTSAAYGKFVNIPFGTDRMDGNIIDTTDPAIEEVVNQESTEAGKGGGQTVNTTTYTYFFTGRIAFCIEGASDLIRLWGDGKVVYDTTGTGQFVKEGWSVTFYPGGLSQSRDPEEASRRGSDIPAYRHLTTIKLDRVPLADFGNRIPNFTAEIAFVSQTNVPLDNMAEPAGLDVPGSFTGADVSRMSINPLRDEFYSLKTGGDSSWTGVLSSMDFKFLFGTGGFAEPTVAWNGFAYHQTGASNSGPLNKKDIETGEVVAALGGSGIGLTDVLSPPNFGNSGYWDFLQVTIPGVGVKTLVFHACAFGTANGSFVDGDNLNILYITSTADGFPADQLTDTTVSIPDHDRGVMYLIANDVANSRYRVIAVTPNFTIGIGGPAGVIPSIVVHDDIPYSAWPSGTGLIQGWAVNRNTGDLMMSNGSSMILYSPSTKAVLATRTNAQGVFGFRGRNNYYTGPIFAWMAGSTTPSASRLFVIDTRTLATIRQFSNIGSLIGWVGTPNSVVHDPSQVWDDRVQAIVFSRVDAGTNATNPNRILKVFVNRVQGLGVGLDFVVKSLSTSYQRQVMAGLSESDINVTTLAGETVQGYTLTRKSTMKSALEPLRMRYQFDAIQSDWIMKFPVRGQSPITTIPEEFVGLLRRGADQNDEPPIREVRADDLSLPMRLSLRYKNKNTDYQIDMEHDKRHLFPNPTMRSKTDRTVDVPLVDVPTNMKKTAQEHLLTIWNERISYKTIIPWTYIKIDPTDVFNLGAFGETHQLRMLENNLGQGWAIDITGVVEDTAQYSSTLGGGLNLGHITPTIPSGLPTRLFPLDAPLLSVADLLLTPISNAYMAVGAFESSWPGATLSKSLDNVTYQNTGSVNSEAATAKVTAVPGAWLSSNGDFPNRFQEVADGGSMTVTAIRRPEFWASATETEVLAGANHIAVVGDDGEVEIIGYVNVVDNGNNTFTLSRLLRGRLGTEDVTQGGMGVSDIVIGLSNASNVKESGPIVRQRLPLTELDVELFFRGVTIGTSASDADPISFTYTGRDLKPYFPAQLAATPDGAGGLNIDWERRTRGPLQGEWLDGTPTVPLNETIEQYEVTLNTVGAGDFATKVVNDATVVNFTQAEVALGGTSGGFGPATDWATPDANFPTGIDPDTAGNWVLHQGAVSQFDTVTSGVVPSGPPPGNTASTGYLLFRVSSTATVTHAMRHDLNIATDLGIDLNSLPDATFFMHFWAAQDRADGGIRVRVEQLNASSAVVGSMDTGERDTGTPYGQWIQYGSAPGTTFSGVPLTMSGVVGAVTLRVIVYCFKRGTTFSTDRSYYDELTLEVVVPPPGITAKVVQVSETGKKSPIAARQVT